MAKTVSETKTENIFREFYGASTFIEKSAIPSEYGFKSKKGTDYKGFPDFFLDKGLYAIIVEAKAILQDKAEEEIMYYMANNKLISKKDLIGIAVSGQSKTTIRVSYYVMLKGEKKIMPLSANKLLSLKDIEKIYLRHKNGDAASAP